MFVKLKYVITVTPILTEPKLDTGKQNALMCFMLYFYISIILDILCLFNLLIMFTKLIQRTGMNNIISCIS